jgi:hypothetical protein
MVGHSQSIWKFHISVNVRSLGVPGLRLLRTAALIDAMGDFYRGVVIGGLAGLVLGGGGAYLIFGWWVTRLLRQLASDTRRLLERTAPPSE